MRVMLIAAAAAAAVASGCLLSRYEVRDDTTGGAGAAPGQGGGGASHGSGGGSGGATTSSSAGPGTTCMTASECPASEQPCLSAVCVQNACTFEPLPPGTPLPDAAVGDCRSRACDMSGSVMEIPANDPVDDNNPCTADACNGTTTVHTPQSGECPGGFCDTAGNCTPSVCSSDADCGIATECYRYTCQFGQCRLEPASAGTFCQGLTNQCDGLGNCVDCVNSGGCDECCVCSDNMCVPARFGARR